uniref:Cytochrome c oxidase subunit 3 n=1 Tax=Hildenbrandia rubra TaxID=31481 RepID=A0A0A7A7S2_9FLOR|nr:cytochrome c oxidase subunit 3 [Hildenbrandia rubra]AHB62129.1 cytochrome c oxidase subunit 3 [Hildenbrandia rubra]
MHNLTTLNKISKITQRHPFHLVDFSPWPSVASLSVFSSTIGGIMYMHGYQKGGLILISGTVMLFATMFVWWRDVTREAVYEGHHTSVVQKGLRFGLILFIVSEILFFLVFLSIFYNSCEPALSVGAMWPPSGITSVDTWKVPFLNTLILLSSGFTVTWAHHAIVANNRIQTIFGLVFTIFYAILFTGIQGFEYYSNPFRLSDGIYGAVFYMTTGFHGFHVIVGTIFLSICFFRLLTYQFTWQHHFGLEAAIWYWHFVDVVWLFLFVAIYWWGDYPQNLL